MEVEPTPSAAKCVVCLGEPKPRVPWDRPRQPRELIWTRNGNRSHPCAIVWCKRNDRAILPRASPAFSPRRIRRSIARLQ